jgi:hypothetical protein
MHIYYETTLKRWKIFHTIAGAGKSGMATSGANCSSLGWKPSGCGGGGPFIIPDKLKKCEYKYRMHINNVPSKIWQINIECI